MTVAASFTAFSGDHLAMLGVLTVLCGVLWMGAKRFSPAQRSCLGRILGGVLIAYVAVSYLRAGLEGRLSWRESLPLHLCNWVLLACIITLFRPQQVGFEIAYFWGLTGTFQALLTPDLPEGFPSWNFLQFFWSHGGSLLAIVFMITGLKLQPRPGSMWRMFIALNIYALVAGLFDALFGWNYGYLRNPPHQASILDHFGPWPWYIVWMEVIALTSFWVLTLPWRWKSRGKQ